LPTLKLDGVASSLDGEYDCQINDLTNRELHQVRLLSGIAPAGILGGLVSGDAGLLVSLAAIILERNGKHVDVDALWDAPGGSSIVFDVSDVTQDSEGDDGPPAQQPSAPGEPGGPGANDGESAASG
jgi:hypothetical protein